MPTKSENQNQVTEPRSPLPSMPFIDSDSDCITDLQLRSTISPVQTRLLPIPAPCLFAAVVHVTLFSRNALCLALLTKSHSTILMVFTSNLPPSRKDKLLKGRTMCCVLFSPRTSEPLNKQSVEMTLLGPGANWLQRFNISFKLSFAIKQSQTDNVYFLFCCLRNHWHASYINLRHMVCWFGWQILWNDYRNRFS